MFARCHCTVRATLSLSSSLNRIGEDRRQASKQANNNLSRINDEYSPSCSVYQLILSIPCDKSSAICIGIHYWRRGARWVWRWLIVGVSRWLPLADWNQVWCQQHHCVVLCNRSTHASSPHYHLRHHALRTQTHSHFTHLRKTISNSRA